MASPGLMKRRPRSWILLMAKPVASPDSIETSTPFWRVVISPRFGPYSLKRWLMMPSPRVRLTRSVSKPIRPRVGMTASTETVVGVVVHVGDFALAVGEVPCRISPSLSAGVST
jgi:hypothetical protein